MPDESKIAAQVVLDHARPMIVDMLHRLVLDQARAEQTAFLDELNKHTEPKVS